MASIEACECATASARISDSVRCCKFLCRIGFVRKPKSTFRADALETKAIRSTPSLQKSFDDGEAVQDDAENGERKR